MTDNEFSKLLDKKLVGVATKKDLKELATKKDLDLVRKDLDFVKKDVSVLKEDAKGFATKNDLKNLVTREDAKNFATRKDLEAVRDDVQRVEFQLKLTEQSFEQKLEDTFSAYTKKMLDKFDEVIGELQMIREEKVFQQAQFERLVERVERLEQHAGLQPLL